MKTDRVLKALNENLAVAASRGLLRVENGRVSLVRCNTDTPKSPPDEPINLKAILMRLGNRLVTDSKFEPAASNGRLRQTITQVLKFAKVPDENLDFLSSALLAAVQMHYEQSKTTDTVAAITEFLNRTPEAQAILEEMGFEWPTAKRPSTVAIGV
jgi:hypothetical protein